MQILFLEVSQDALSLPKQVCTSIEELSVLSGVNVQYIYNNISRARQREKKGNVAKTKRSFPRFARVEIPDEELITDEMWEHYQKWKGEHK